MRGPLVSSLIVASVALAVPASATAAGPLSKPIITRPTSAPIISTPSGSRAAIAVPVTYQLDVEPPIVRRAALTMNLKATVVLPSGKTLKAKPDRKGLQGMSVWNIEHHAFLSKAQTKTLLAATEDSKAGVAKVRLRATERADIDLDGAVDATATASRQATLPPPTTQLPDDADDSGHAQGSDPCGYYNIQNCVNQGGDTWDADHFWAEHSWTLQCTNPAFPYPTGPGDDAGGTFDTTSNRYVDSWTAQSDGSTQQFVATVSDDNVSGHPYSYQPFIACGTTSPS